jgi:hypothetical protein
MLFCVIYFRFAKPVCVSVVFWFSWFRVGPSRPTNFKPKTQTKHIGFATRSQNKHKSPRCLQRYQHGFVISSWTQQFVHTCKHTATDQLLSERNFTQLVCTSSDSASWSVSVALFKCTCSDNAPAVSEGCFLTLIIHYISMPLL